MKGNNYDFSGYATRNDLLCGDGRTIRKNAFKDNDGKTVPMIWNHDHSTPDAVLGHALLENREDGVYAYCTFNDTDAGQSAKQLVSHGDVRALSIYANKLKQIGNDVIHGSIKELSLVLAGANPGAYIDFVVEHGDDEEDSDGFYACYDESALVLSHALDEKEEKEEKPEEKKEGGKMPNQKTVEEMFNEFTDEQKDFIYSLVGAAVDSALKGDDEGEVKHSDIDDEEDNVLKHNVFDTTEENSGYVLSHADTAKIFARGKQLGSLKEAVAEYCDTLSHADGDGAEYGIDNLDFLFPEDRNITESPIVISRNMDWVSKVMGGVHHTPFSRVKSLFADITEDAARAKGYIKGKLKKEEVFSLLKRSTSPTTVYKKQKMDRDDMIDLDNFAQINWLKKEMRTMLDEEIARAIMFGDQRLASDDDHISTDNIRPVIDDADLFVIRWAVAAGSSEDDLAKAFIRAAIKSRKNYKGSGRPVLYTTEDMLTNMLLLEDDIGHALYASEAALATKLRVSEIVTVPVMEGLKDKDDKDVYGVIVNLADYNVGADKGGAVSLFDDFDIDYNQQKYLIETRCSGALTVPFSAIVLRSGSETKSEEPTIAEATAPFKARS